MSYLNSTPLKLEHDYTVTFFKSDDDIGQTMLETTNLTEAEAFMHGAESMRRAVVQNHGEGNRKARHMSICLSDGEYAQYPGDPSIEDQRRKTEQKS